MLSPRLRAKYSLNETDTARELNFYEADKLAAFHGIKDFPNQLPIILGSKSGDFLRHAHSRREAYEDTEVLWLTREAKSASVFGSQGQGKTMLTTSIVVQLITALKRFGEEFKQFDFPHIILDAAGEFSHNHFALPLENPRLLERMQPYYKYMPFLKPTSIIEKCKYYVPVHQMKNLKARDIYGDEYIGLNASDLTRLDPQEAYQIALDLLNIKEEDPAARMVRGGCVEFMKENPSFCGMYRIMLEDEQREIKRRRSQSVSRQGQIMLRNLLVYGEADVMGSPDIESDLNERKVAIYHFPVQSSKLRINKAMFTAYLALALDYVKQGSPPFSLYGEEMHKPLTEEPNSVFSRRFRDIYELERKSGRLVFSILRRPEYADILIDESNLLFSPQTRAESAKMLEGYVPQPGINFAIEELQMRSTLDGRLDANEWMMLEKGRGYKRFFPIPPLVQP